MRLFCIAILVFMCANWSLAQEWMERDGVAYKCETIRAILEEYGEHEFARIAGQVATVDTFFFLVFPLCPSLSESADPAVEIADNVATEEEENGPVVVVENSLYSYSSREDGQEQVLGPMTLSKGLYLITVVTDDAILIRPKSENEDCGFDFRYKSTGVSVGHASRGIQTLYQAESDCRVLFEISLVSEDWTFDIERVDPQEPPVMEIAEGAISLSSAELGKQPVLGPISIAAGTYVFSANGDSALNVRLYTLTAECGIYLERSIFLLSPEEASEGAEQAVTVESDCNVLLDVTGLSKDWTVVIEKAF